MVPVATDIEVIRALIPDLQAAPERLFTDAQLQVYLDIDANPVRAAALAIEAVATNEALLLKNLTITGAGTLRTDGARVSDALLARARQLRATADEGGDFEIAELVVNPTTAAQRLYKQAQRGLLG